MAKQRKDTWRLGVSTKVTPDTLSWLEELHWQKHTSLSEMVSTAIEFARSRPEEFLQYYQEQL